MRDTGVPMMRPRYEVLAAAPEGGQQRWLLEREFLRLRADLLAARAGGAEGGGREGAARSAGAS